MRRRTLRTRTKQFLYKAMHGTQKVGKHWRNRGDKAQRELCKTCYSTESMELILLHCQAPPTRIIWSLAKDLWPHEQSLWPEINLGIILGCGTITLPSTNPPQVPAPGENTEPRTKTQGTGRLLQILLSEAAHLIWVLRCERTMPDPPKEHTAQEITARWYRVINTRLTEDKLAATKIKRNDQAISTARET